MENLISFLYFLLAAIISSATAFYFALTYLALKVRVNALAFKWNPDYYSIDPYYTVELYKKQVSKQLRPTIPWLLFFHPLKWLRSYQQILDSKSKFLKGSFNSHYQCCLVLNTNRWYEVVYNAAPNRELQFISTATNESIFELARIHFEEEMYTWIVQKFVPKHLRILAYKVLPPNTVDHPIDTLLTCLPEKHQQAFQQYFIAKFTEYCRENFKPN